MIKLPISITDSNGTVETFDSLEDAERSLEAVDVLANEYRACDACGTALMLRVEKQKVRLWYGLVESEVDVVKISPL